MSSRDHALVPAAWTFAELIPRQEVLARMQGDYELAALGYEEAAIVVAREYMQANLECLRLRDPAERERYMRECEAIGAKINQRPCAPKSTIDQKAKDLELAFDGGLTAERANTIKEGAFALKALQSLGDKKQTNERINNLTEFMRKTCARLNRENSET